MKKSGIVAVLIVASMAVACGSSGGPKIEAGANLTRANLVDQNLSGRDLAGANLTSADLTGSDLSQANLRGANLTGANLTRANLSSADLSGANLTSVTVDETDLTGANLTGATFDQVVLEKQKGGPTTTTTSTTSTTTAPEPEPTPPAPPQKTLVGVRVKQIGKESYFVGDKVVYQCAKYYDYSDGSSTYEFFKLTNQPCPVQ